MRWPEQHAAAHGFPAIVRANERQRRSGRQARPGGSSVVPNPAAPAAASVAVPGGPSRGLASGVALLAKKLVVVAYQLGGGVAGAESGLEEG